MERDKQLYLIVGKRKIPIDLSAYSMGYGIIEATSHDNSVSFRIVCDDYVALATQLQEMTARVRGRSVAEVAGGIIRDETAALPAERWNNIRLEDIPTDDPLTAWKLIYLRFKDSEIGELASLAQHAGEMYYSLLKRTDKINNLETKVDGLATPAQTLAADIAAVEHLDLIDNGRPVWGAQSRVAEALGITNDGATNRKRILAVLDELAARERRAA